jgi:glycosyltransferase involved in cell wall biosynthesis
MLMCWTPREIVRSAAAPLITTFGLPYIVHLEDNEELLTRLWLEEFGPSPPTPLSRMRSHPTRYKDFLTRSSGVTVIADLLREVVPQGVPTELLEPGIDLDLFGAPQPAARARTIRGALGVAPDDRLLVYPGNIHRGNVEDMRSLYEAVRMLRAEGRKVVLVRTGKDSDSTLDFLQDANPASGFYTLGPVARPFLIELLKCADVFVQPGEADAFNDYRLPSKLPEFFAVGRPVILPRANIGLRVRDHEDALLLRDRSPGEIARLVGEVLDSPDLHRKLSENAQAFARANFDWARQGQVLDAFIRRAV